MNLESPCIDPTVTRLPTQGAAFEAAPPALSCRTQRAARPMQGRRGRVRRYSHRGGDETAFTAARVARRAGALRGAGHRRARCAIDPAQAVCDRGSRCLYGSAPAPGRPTEPRRRVRSALPGRPARRGWLRRAEEAPNRYRREPETRNRHDPPRAPPGRSTRYAVRQHSLARVGRAEGRTGGAVPVPATRPSGPQGIRPLQARQRADGRHGRELPHEPRPLDAGTGARRNGGVWLPQSIQPPDAVRSSFPCPAASRSGDDVGAGDVSGPAQGRAGCAGPRTAAGGPRALDGGQVAGVAESGAFQPSEPTSNRRCLSEQR
jgi:hypothetical protein